MLTFCTLFDENYIDKGLVLYKSLERVSKAFTLYILCMSEKCYDVLADLKWVHIHPVRLSDFENEELLRIKSSRSVGEYCWTCGSSFTKYVIDTFQPEYCSYIDADLAFYDDPQCIIDEMKRRKASVSIVGHRFNKDVAQEQEWKVGKYCVECNTFKNDKKGMAVLNLWTRQCLEYCSPDEDGVHFADQKYMDNWVDDYPYVIETENLGMGVAPWNISQYRLISVNGNDIRLKCEKCDCRLLFYHFQGLRYIDRKHANIGVMAQKEAQPEFVYLLYDQYLAEIDFYKNILNKKYGIDIFLKLHPGLKIDQLSYSGKIKIYAIFVLQKILGKNIIYLYKLHNGKNVRAVRNMHLM